jgi:uncharacterized protein
MKLLLLLAALALGLWLWRSGRGGSSPQSKIKPSAKSNPAAPKAQEMVPCKLCQMHVPQAEAIAGTQGSYCCEQHRRQAES